MSQSTVAINENTNKQFSSDRHHHPSTTTRPKDILSTVALSLEADTIASLSLLSSPPPCFVLRSRASAENDSARCTKRTRTQHRQRKSENLSISIVLPQKNIQEFRDLPIATSLQQVSVTLKQHPCNCHDGIDQWILPLCRRYRH
jgi:hypothetical protein